MLPTPAKTPLAQRRGNTIVRRDNDGRYNYFMYGVISARKLTPLEFLRLKLKVLHLKCGDATKQFRFFQWAKWTTVQGPLISRAQRSRKCYVLKYFHTVRQYLKIYLRNKVTIFERKIILRSMGLLLTQTVWEEGEETKKQTLFWNKEVLWCI
jgi:hypothetical protein